MDRRRTRSPLQTISTPDVTPLVDLTFLLLIVFMITAPTLEFSLNLSPPELNSENIRLVDHQIVNIDRDGILHLGNLPVTRNVLQNEIEERFTENKNLEILIYFNLRHNEISEMTSGEQIFLLKRFGFSDGIIADLFGKSKSYISSEIVKQKKRSNK